MNNVNIFDWTVGLLEIFQEFKLSRLIVVVALLMTARSYLRIKKKHKKISLEEEETKIIGIYTKDEDGFYPWEIDINDHPSRISKDSKKISNDWGPKRGHW